MTGVEIFYTEWNNPTMLAGTYSFKFYPDPTNALDYRNYDQTQYYGG